MEFVLDWRYLKRLDVQVGVAYQRITCTQPTLCAAKLTVLKSSILGIFHL